MMLEGILGMGTIVVALLVAWYYKPRVFAAAELVVDIVSQ